MAGTATTQDQVITTARFVIDLDRIGRIAFSELNGITTKVTPQEYIYNSDTGATVHTKQFGKTEPPTISLKRGLDAEGNAKLMAWHRMARLGLPQARANGTLTVMDASGSEQTQIVYQISRAWCTDLIISGMKAGESAVSTIECKITCEEILIPPANG